MFPRGVCASFAAKRIKRERHTLGPPLVLHSTVDILIITLTLQAPSMPPASPHITILSPQTNTSVHSHLVIIIGQASPAPPQGSYVTVTTPAQLRYNFPVHASGRFKVVAPLVPGPNALHFNVGGVTADHMLAYEPQPNNPAIDLVIVAGRDSPLRFDDVRPTTLDDAVRRYRMAAYLWQAYTSEQMTRHGFGPRTFQFTEERGNDTTVGPPGSPGPQASVAKITVVRSKRTMAEIRNTNLAQQNKHAQSKESLFDIAGNAVKEAPEFSGDKLKGRQFVALIIDATHTRDGLITGHAALGGNIGGNPFAIFGSHTCFSWPTCVDEIPQAFLSQQPVDTRYCGIDCEGKVYGMAANVGIGAMMHEVGHSLGSPHQSSGVMLRDYTRLHKSFLAVDADDNNECAWHRLDALRYVGHPGFASPYEQSRGIDAARQPILLTATHDMLHVYTPTSRILAIEYRMPGKETADTFTDFTTQQNGPPNSHSFQRQYLDSKGFDRITVLTTDGGRLNDVQLKDTIGMYPTRPGVVRTNEMGRQNGNAVTIPVPPNLNRIRVHAGMALDGVELFPGGLIFGKRGGRPADFNLQGGEFVIGFNLRYGAWVDGIQVVTNQRVSQWFGNGTGGGPGEARVPAGYRWSAIVGHVADWCQGIGFEFEPAQH